MPDGASIELGGLESGHKVAVVQATTAPDAPVAPAVTATSATSISASWAAPAGDGDSPITSYDLRHSTDGVTWTTIVGAVSPQAITGLVASTTYQVQVRALNAVGTGAWSASGSATTPAV